MASEYQTGPWSVPDVRFLRLLLRLGTHNMIDSGHITDWPFDHRSVRRVLPVGGSFLLLPW